MSPFPLANVVSGSLVALLNVSVALSVAALLFAQTDPRLLVPGIGILLVGTLISGLVGSLGSGYSSVICSPRNGLVPVFAVMITAIYGAFGGRYSIAVEATIVTAMMITTLLTGLFLLLLGKLRLGNLVRYIPYPVTGGFFAGIGYIFVQGGLSVAAGSEFTLGSLLQPDLILVLLPALCLALSFIFGKAIRDSQLLVPLLLFVAVLLFYGYLSLAGISITEAAQRGLLPVIEDSGRLLPIFHAEYLGQIDWMLILRQGGGMVVVALLCAMMLLLDVSGIEIISRSDLDPDHELKIMGYANVLSGFFGGFPGVHDASDTALVNRLGGQGRMAGIIYAALVVAALLAGTDFLGYVPTFILGGLLIYVGLEFLVVWLWQARKELPLSDYVVVIVILVVIMFSDILQGVIFGFFIAIILFVINYSKLSVIKSELDGSEHASNVDRDLETRELLNQEGFKILILNLQGFIFFGTADKLLASIRNRIADRSDNNFRYLVLDFHYVSQLDTSAFVTFSKLAQLSDRLGFDVVISSADENSIKRLVHHGFFTFGEQSTQRIYKDQLDTAVDWCEQKILSSLDRFDAMRSMSLEEVLSRIIQRDEQVDSIRGYFEEVAVSQGDYLFTEGDEGDSLFIVGTGTVVVVIQLSSDHEKVLRKYKAGAMLGEMALYTGENRSASVRIEEDAVLYKLTEESMLIIQAEYPVAAAALHSYVVRLMSERLRRANRELSRYI